MTQGELCMQASSSATYEHLEWSKHHTIYKLALVLSLPCDPETEIRLVRTRIWSLIILIEQWLLIYQGTSCINMIAHEWCEDSSSSENFNEGRLCMYICSFCNNLNTLEWSKHHTIYKLVLGSTLAAMSSKIRNPACQDLLMFDHANKSSCDRYLSNKSAWLHHLNGARMGLHLKTVMKVGYVCKLPLHR